MRGTLPWWMRVRRILTVDDLPVEIVGFDKDDDESDEDEDDDDEDESSSEEETSDEDEDEDDDDEESDDSSEKDEKDDDKDEAAGLKSALKKERKARKALQRELKAIQKQLNQGKKDDKDDKDTQSEEELRKAREANEKLAERLRDQAVDAELERVARKYNFRDPEDVLRLADRDEIDVDQDDDDPTSVTVDTEDIDRVVKALKKKKPHLVGSGDSSRTKSGSKFGGGKKKTKRGSEQKLKEKYPALRS